MMQHLNVIITKQNMNEMRHECLHRLIDWIAIPNQRRKNNTIFSVLLTVSVGPSGEMCSPNIL